MKCEQCKERLVDYLYEEVDEATRAEMDAALEACPDCRAELAALRSTHAAFMTLEPLEMPAKLHNDILRQARVTALERRPKRSPLAAFFAGPAFGLAFSAMLLGGGAWLFRSVAFEGTTNLDASTAEMVAAAESVDDRVAQTTSPERTPQDELLDFAASDEAPEDLEEERAEAEAPSAAAVAPGRDQDGMLEWESELAPEPEPNEPSLEIGDGFGAGEVQRQARAPGRSGSNSDIYVGQSGGAVSRSGTPRGAGGAYGYVAEGRAAEGAPAAPSSPGFEDSEQLGGMANVASGGIATGPATPDVAAPTEVAAAPMREALPEMEEDTGTEMAPQLGGSLSDDVIAQAPANEGYNDREAMVTGESVGTRSRRPRRDNTSSGASNDGDRGASAPVVAAAPAPPAPRPASAATNPRMEERRASEDELVATGAGAGYDGYDTNDGAYAGANAGAYDGAEAAFDSGDMVRAADELDAYLSDAPAGDARREEALMMAGIANMEQGRLDEARSVLQRLLREFPNTSHRADAEVLLEDIRRQSQEAESRRNRSAPAINLDAMPVPATDNE